MNQNIACRGCLYNTPKKLGGVGRVCNGYTQERYGRCPEWKMAENATPHSERAGAGNTEMSGCPFLKGEKMQTLLKIRRDGTKSVAEREMAASRQLYPHSKKRAIENHAAKLGIPQHESERYYDFVSTALNEGRED